MYTAELSAVDRAIGFVLNKEWREDLLILTDNQGVVKDVGNNTLNFNKHRIVLCIREKIFEYKGFARDRDNSEVKVVIGWVPPHRGITRKPTGSQRTRPQRRKTRFKIPARDWRSVMKEEVEEMPGQTRKRGDP